MTGLLVLCLKDTDARHATEILVLAMIFHTIGLTILCRQTTEQIRETTFHALRKTE